MSSKLLTAVEATGAGDAIYVDSISQHTVSVTFTNSGGGVTALTVDLEGSIDGTNYFSLDSHVLTAGELTALGAMFHVVNKPVRYVRANITTLTETGTTAVSVVYYGFEDAVRI